MRGKTGMRKVTKGVATQQKVIEERGCRDGGTETGMREGGEGGREGGREGGCQGGKAVNEPSHCTYQNDPCNSQAACKRKGSRRAACTTCEDDDSIE